MDMETAHRQGKALFQQAVSGWSIICHAFRSICCSCTIKTLTREENKNTEGNIRGNTFLSTANATRIVSRAIRRSVRTDRWDQSGLVNGAVHFSRIVGKAGLKHWSSDLDDRGVGCFRKTTYCWFRKEFERKEKNSTSSVCRAIRLFSSRGSAQPEHSTASPHPISLRLRASEKQQ